MPINLLELLFGKREKTAKQVARDRLQLVLLHDRADIPAPVMEEIRRDLLAVLSKYVEIDEAALEVSVGKVEGSVALTASIPVRRVLMDNSAAPST